MICLCFVVAIPDATQAAGNNKFGIPKIAVTYDLNTFFPVDDAYGPRMQIFSNNRHFRSRKHDWDPTKNTLTYAYGIGLGSYKVSGLEQKGSDNDMYHTYAMLLCIYQNKSIFEPFVGVYPGFTWGSKDSFFVNPTAGVNIMAFSINRNWNSKLLQAYVQFRIEYNTSLSSFFCGGGVILQFMR